MSSTMGVANKTLPCGTHVKVCLDRSGPCVNVTVIDRGPYVVGREFDLTEATARRIGFLSEGVGPIWVALTQHNPAYETEEQIVAAKTAAKAIIESGARHRALVAQWSTVLFGEPKSSGLSSRSHERGRRRERPRRT